jgi:hypothetical protein
MVSKNDKLEYFVDRGECKAMDYIEEIDASNATEVYECDLTEELIPKRRSSNPKESKHLWREKVLTNLEIGEHKIEIKISNTRNYVCYNFLLIYLHIYIP